MTRPRTEPPLAKFGPYDLVEKVGAGGMGSVYRARDTRGGRTVALKLMHEHVAGDPSYAERFRREAAMAALIDSPNVVRLLEFASDGGRPYIVTEFVEGPGVDLLLKNGPLSPAEAAAIAAGVATALTAASQRGIVHRDIKPGNILIGQDGVPKVTDFGIATLNHSSSLTVPGMFIGTAAYAAPEQHRGEADVRSDLYSLGVVLFEMLTGSLPFEADTATGMMRKHEESPVPRERLAGQPPALVTAVTRCLEKSPARRFQHPGELVGLLLGGHLAQGSPVEDTIIALAPVPAVPMATLAAIEADLSATRIDSGAGLLATGEHPLAPAPPLAAVQAKLSELPLLRKALVAAGVVACVTVLAMIGLTGSSASSEQGNAGNGRGISGPLIDAGETPTPGADITVTRTPPEKDTVTPTPTFTPTATPTSTPTATPTQKAPLPPAPAPVLDVVDWTICHTAGCATGDEDLYAGYLMFLGFQLSAPTNLSVAVEVWFDGEYQYTSNFSASSNGYYYDVLPWADYGGELALDVYVGGDYLTTLWADVY